VEAEEINSAGLGATESLDTKPTSKPDNEVPVEYVSTDGDDNEGSSFFDQIK
jgi:hypothetical protein